MNRIRQYALPVMTIAMAIALGGCAQHGMKDATAMDNSAMRSHESVVVGGESMLPDRNIVQNAVNSANHKTLVAALKQAELVDTLSSAGPFTVFAPTDAAFGKLPKSALQSLMQDRNKDKLRHILKYHVVPGKFTAKDLMERIKHGGGQATLKTASGDKLTIEMNGPMNVVLNDEQGHTAHISTYDVDQSNGVIHVVDTVLIPAG